MPACQDSAAKPNACKPGGIIYPRCVPVTKRPGKLQRMPPRQLLMNPPEVNPVTDTRKQAKATSGWASDEREYLLANHCLQAHLIHGTRRMPKMVEQNKGIR